MNVSSSTILVTGGSTGIGFALAKRLAEAGSRVVVCGRREDALARAKAEVPALETIVCDVADEAARVALFERVRTEYPDLNVLVNNAGVQIRPPRFDQGVEWAAVRNELAINYEAPVHLATLFVPFLVGQREPALVNVTSGLAFVPLAFMPTYCATKAALHSFTMSLRYQLRETPLRVIEVAPPAVDTDLGGPGLHTFGVPLDEFADFAFAKLKEGDEEFAYGSAEHSRQAGREGIQALFQMMHSRG